jgi:hypothetical protein
MAFHCDTYLIEKCASYANNAYTDLTQGTFIEDNKTDCQAFVIVDGDDIIITGQGTTTVTDWTINFQLWRKRVSYLENTMVHSGFIKQYEAVRDRIHDEICKHLRSKKIKRIVCTGHSLFGAISTIIALDCAIVYPVQVCCVTFGSPRVGSNSFAKLFDKLVGTSFRCVRHKDPIVFSPLPGRFRHVRGGIHFGKDISFNMPLYNCIGCRVSHHNMEDYLLFIHGINEKKKQVDIIYEPDCTSISNDALVVYNADINDTVEDIENFVDIVDNLRKHLKNSSKKPLKDTITNDSINIVFVDDTNDSISDLVNDSELSIKIV